MLMEDINALFSHYFKLLKECATCMTVTLFRVAIILSKNYPNKYN